MADRDRENSPRRDWRGRYVTGRSGNLAGRPRGALNRATRIAAELLDGEAEALLRAEIDLAKAGDRVLLRHCNDRIIAPQRAQPVVFAMPRIEDARRSGRRDGRRTARGCRGADHTGRGGNAGTDRGSGGARRRQRRADRARTRRRRTRGGRAAFGAADRGAHVLRRPRNR